MTLNLSLTQLAVLTNTVLSPSALPMTFPDHFVFLFLPTGWLHWEAHSLQYFIYQAVHYLHSNLFTNNSCRVIGHILTLIIFSIKYPIFIYTNEATRYKTAFPSYSIVYILLVTVINLLSASRTHTACIIHSGVTWRRSQSAHWNTTWILLESRPPRPAYRPWPRPRSVYKINPPLQQKRCCAVWEKCAK